MDTRKALHEVLKEKGCATYGRNFQIDKFEERDKCVDWIIESILNPMNKKLYSDPVGETEFAKKMKDAVQRSYSQAFDDPNRTIKSPGDVWLYVEGMSPPIEGEAPRSPQEPRTRPNGGAVRSDTRKRRQSESNGS